MISDRYIKDSVIYVYNKGELVYIRRCLGLKVRCLWNIILPFKFGTTEQFEIDSFTVEDITIRPIRTNGSKFYDSIQVVYYTEIDDELVPKDIYDMHRTIELKQNLTRSIGVKVNRFINAYYRQVETHIINQVFNGEDFITSYELRIFDLEGHHIDGLTYFDNGVHLLNKDLVEKINNDINNVHKDMSQEFLRLASCFQENGYLDMSFMNLALALESYIKRLIFFHGLRPQDLYDGKGYVEKFYHVGLKKVKGKSLMEEMPEIYDLVNRINDIRNDLAHGESINNSKYFEGMTMDQIYDLLDDYIWEVEDLFEWINK
jgi:hypothetical protein